jgi:DNA-binding transcriptional MerR regulator
MPAELPAIPAKRYFTIGEVSDLCGVKAHVLRYWEQEFTQLRPVKRRGNRRYYQHHEVLLVRRIRQLLYEDGFTISGARNRLSGDAGAEAAAAATRTRLRAASQRVGSPGPAIEALIDAPVDVSVDAPIDASIHAASAPGDATGHGPEGPTALAMEGLAASVPGVLPTETVVEASDARAGVAWVGAVPAGLADLFALRDELLAIRALLEP